MPLSVRDDPMGLAIKLLSEVGHSEELVFMPYLFALANSASNEKPAACVRPADVGFIGI